jgi:hypothetical protein
MVSRRGRPHLLGSQLELGDAERAAVLNAAWA